MLALVNELMALSATVSVAKSNPALPSWPALARSRPTNLQDKAAEKRIGFQVSPVDDLPDVRDGSRPWSKMLEI